MDKRYQLLIYNSTAGSVEHTIGSSNLRSIPQAMGGQVIRPLEGRAESQPWQVEVTDVDDYFTQIISSGGRYVLLNRLAEMQVSVDGSTYDTVAVGRISAIQDYVSHYNVTIDDERTIERTAEIFTEVETTMGSTSLYAGTRVLPPGVNGTWRQFSPGFNWFYAPYTLTEHTTVGNFSLIAHEALVYNGELRTDDEVLSAMPEIVALITDDLKDTIDLTTDQAGGSTSGAFDTLRCYVNGAAREVIGFTLSQSSSSFPAQRESITDELRKLASGEKTGDLNVWVLSTASLGSSTTAYLYMPTHEPTAAMPLHIGGGYNWQTGATDPLGIRPFQLVQDIYDEIGVIYSTSVMQGLINDPRFGFYNMRITQKYNAAQFLEDHVFKPLGVVPTVNATGAVAPILIVTPESSDVAGDTTGLPLFGSTNTAWPHPDWYHADPVTRIKFHTKSYSLGRPFDIGPTVIFGNLISTGARATIGHGLDFVVEHEREVVREHDRIDQMGVHEISMAFDGFLFWSELDYQVPWDARQRAETLAEQIFSRHGDGSVRGTLVPLTSSDRPDVGDYVRLSIPTFPTANTTGRGGGRVVQIVSITEQAEGPVCEWLDAGPELQPLSAPSVSLAPSATLPKHRLTATISSLTSGASYELALASGGSAPGSTGNWASIATGTTDDLTLTIDSLASGTTYHARVKAYQVNRIASTWSGADSTETETLTAPSGLASSSVTGNTAILYWTDNEPDYGSELHLDESATCPSSGLELARRMEKGTAQTKLEALTLDTTHCVGLRYYDIFGGYSTMSGLSIQTTTTPEVAPNMADLMILAGADQVSTST